MLMHHSRNTEQKQWDETLVLVLAGLTKVRAHHERAWSDGRTLSPLIHHSSTDPVT